MRDTLIKADLGALGRCAAGAFLLIAVLALLSVAPTRTQGSAFQVKVRL